MPFTGISCHFPSKQYGLDCKVVILLTLRNSTGRLSHCVLRLAVRSTLASVLSRLDTSRCCDIVFVSLMRCYRGCVHGPTCVSRACVFYRSYGTNADGVFVLRMLGTSENRDDCVIYICTLFTSSYAHLQAVSFAFCFAAAIYECSM